MTQERREALIMNALRRVRVFNISGDASPGAGLSRIHVEVSVHHGELPEIVEAFAAHMQTVPVELPS